MTLALASKATCLDLALASSITDFGLGLKNAGLKPIFGITQR